MSASKPPDPEREARIAAAKAKAAAAKAAKAAAAGGAPDATPAPADPAASASAPAAAPADGAGGAPPPAPAAKKPALTPEELAAKKEAALKAAAAKKAAAEKGGAAAGTPAEKAAAPAKAADKPAKPPAKGKKKEAPQVPDKVSPFEREMMAVMRKVSLLSDLEEGYLYRLVKESEYKRIEVNETICREGDYGTTFWVMLGGMVKILKRGADGKNVYLASIGQGSFFGEMGPMSAQPRAATVVAETECRLLEIPEDTFFFFRESSDHFRKIIDDAYRERALIGHLAIAPLFKGLDRAHLKKVSDIAELVTLEKGEKAVVEDEPSDAFYLVRHGYLRVTKMRGEQDEIIAYLRDNTYFGENALLGGGRAISTVTAMSDVECVKITKPAFESLLADVPALAERQKVLADEQVSRLKEMREVPDSGKMEVLIRKGLVQTRDALVIDTRKCTKCETCVKSCSAVHGGHALIQLTGMRVGDILFPASCYQCKTPECMLACRFGAITRDRSGQVYINEDACTGCSICSRKCPYGTLFMVDREEDEDAEAKGFFQRIFAALTRKKEPEAFEFLPQDASKKKAKRLAVKCDQCMGHGFTACVYNCPTGAIERVKSEKLYELL